MCSLKFKLLQSNLSIADTCNPYKKVSAITRCPLYSFGNVEQKKTTEIKMDVFSYNTSKQYK